MAKATAGLADVTPGEDVARGVPAGVAVNWLRYAAIASFASAVTTLALILLPFLFADTTGFEGRIARVMEWPYRVRAWVYFVHPFLTTFAAVGMYALLRRRAPVLATVGLVGFAVWGLTEAAQQAFTLRAFDAWRVAWLAGDAEIRAQMPMLVRLYDGIWDAMYVLLLVAFLVGDLAYATALRGVRGLGSVIAWLYVLAAVLTAMLFAGEFGAPLPGGAIMTAIYLIGQPLARALIGVALWRASRQSSPDAASFVAAR